MLGSDDPAAPVDTVLINEVLTHSNPPEVDAIQYRPEAGGVEYVKLRNLLDREVPLFDPAHPANAWRIRGFGFVFPTNIVLPPNGQLVVAATNVAAFSTQYAVTEHILVFEAVGAALQDEGEQLELQRPGLPGTNGPTYITVDEVFYRAQSPWPPGAAGGGASLQRISPSAYGNDPANWVAAEPTVLRLGKDSDQDGQPDDWEVRHGLDPSDPTDANLDSDGDGMLNRQEYVAGTNPTDQWSCLRLDSVAVAAGHTTLGFWAVSNRTYTIERADALQSSVWSKLGDIFAGDSSHAVFLDDPDFATNRFYRLVTPRRP